jgi:renal tumor antigen
MGTPPQELLDKFQKNATHMKLEFASKKFVGIAKLIPHVSSETQDLILKMLTYNADDRFTASQCLKHPCFKDLRELDQAQFTAGPTGFTRSLSKSNLVENTS